jgi:hypothetical protein
MVLRAIFCRFFCFRKGISKVFSTDTIAYKDISWEPESLEKSAGNIFPVNFWSKSAGNK